MVEWTGASLRRDFTDGKQLSVYFAVRKLTWALAMGDAHDTTNATCLGIYIGFLTHGWSCVSGKQKKVKKQNFSASDIRSSFGCFALHTIYGVLYTTLSFSETGAGLMCGVYCRNACSLFEHVMEFPNILQQ